MRVPLVTKKLIEKGTNVKKRDDISYIVIEQLLMVKEISLHVIMNEFRPFIALYSYQTIKKRLQKGFYHIVTYKTFYFRDIN